MRSKAYRLHQAARVIKARVKQGSLYAKGLPVQAGKVNGRHLHSLADRSPLDCGHTQCRVCRTDKKEMVKKRALKEPLEE